MHTAVLRDKELHKCTHTVCHQEPKARAALLWKHLLASAPRESPVHTPNQQSNCPTALKFIHTTSSAQTHCQTIIHTLTSPNTLSNNHPHTHQPKHTVKQSSTQAHQPKHTVRQSSTHSPARTHYRVQS